MNNIYPSVSIKEESGITVFSRMSTQNMEEFRIDVPYMRGIADKVEKLDTEPKGFILATDQPVVAEKVALYINYLFRKAGNDLKEDNIFLENARNSFWEDDDVEEEINSELAVMDLGISAANNMGIENLYLKVLQASGIGDDEALLITGLETCDDIKDKLNAIKAVRDGKTFIQIPKTEINANWVADFQMNSGFELILIKNVANEYYCQVAEELLKDNGYRLVNGFDTFAMVGQINRKRGFDFREEDIEWSIKHAIKNCMDRGSHTNELTKEDFSLTGQVEKTAFEIISELPGLEKPKKVLNEIMAFGKEEARNEKLKDIRKNMIFAGNPGTAKTTIATLAGRLLAECGVSNGNCVVASRSDLIGEVVGKTAIKTRKMFDNARGGVLLIDEAGFLLNTNSGGYVQECIKEIVRYMEMYPDVMVIMACYKSEVEAILNLDAGLTSRFSRIVPFDDYTDKELIDIAEYMYKERGYKWGKAANKKLLIDYITTLRKTDNFGNARDIRKIVDNSIIKHSLRNMEEGKDENVISSKDMKCALEDLEVKKEKVHRPIGFQCQMESNTAC